MFLNMNFHLNRAEGNSFVSNVKSASIIVSFMNFNSLQREYSENNYRLHTNAVLVDEHETKSFQI